MFMELVVIKPNKGFLVKKNVLCVCCKIELDLVNVNSSCTILCC